MKKTSIIALAMILSLAACKKDASTVNTSGSAITLKQRNLVVNNSYTDMVLLPRNPGENFDTYSAGWNSMNVKVYGPLSWNSQLYPTLANGVPLVGASITTDENSSISVENSGPDGNVFEGTQGVLGFGSLNDFQTDIDKYYAADAAFYAAGSVGVPPAIGDYVMNSYTASETISFTGKLIRVTTGSGVAIASIGYPLPTAVKSTGLPSTYFYINDPDQVNHVNVKYALYGTNGSCTQGTIENTSTAIVVTGSYTYLGNGVFQFWGTVIRTDGTSFSFNITDNPS
jgi:hypothetical protein